MVAPGFSLLTVCVWLTPQTEALRLSTLLSALALLGLVIARQLVAVAHAYSDRVQNQALAQANQQLATMNRHLYLLATTDSLTGLSNRAILEESLRRRSSDASHGAHDALLLLDLDRFKEVNDTLGHRFGDLLLKQIGLRLVAALAGKGRVARLGGDEFAMVLPGADAEQACVVARRCLDALDVSFTIEGHTLHAGGSIGVAVAPEHGRDISTLLRCADVAMYLAKRRHCGVMTYTPAEDQYSPQRLALSGELQQAIAQGKLCLEYQPIAQLASGDVLRVEALVRWQHPSFGRVSPDQFVPLAEQSGLIVPLTRWVLDTALRQCRTWLNMGLSIGVAVNVSMRNLQDAHLPELVQELLLRSKVPPDRVTLEITESVLMADPAVTLGVLARLHKLGVRIAIDDFGTGHSSLGYLKRLPVHELKIDQAFVLSLAAHDTAGSSKDRMIVRSVIALAHALGLEVVAEGVETERAWELLRAFHCNAVQGFYLSPSLSARDFETWLRAAGSLSSRSALAPEVRGQALLRVPALAPLPASPEDQDLRRLTAQLGASELAVFGQS